MARAEVDIKVAAVKNPNLPARYFDRMQHHEHARVRAAWAMVASLHSALALAADDDEFEVRRGVWSNPRTPDWLRERLAPEFA